MRKKIDEAICRYCESTDIYLEVREGLLASPMGTFSLTGVQTKFSARMVPSYWLVCGGCGYESEGKNDG